MYSLCYHSGNAEDSRNAKCLIHQLSGNWTKKATLLQQYNMEKQLFCGHCFCFPEEPFAEELRLQKENALFTALALCQAGEREQEQSFLCMALVLPSNLVCHRGRTSHSTSGRRAPILLILVFLERSSMWVDFNGQGVIETWLGEVDVVIIPSVLKALQPTR